MCIHKLTYITSILVFVLQFQLPAEQPEIWIGEWETGRGAVKIFESPLGAVYRIKESPAFRCQAYMPSQTKDQHKKNCNCSSCKARREAIEGVLQFNFRKSGFKRTRYIAIDFFARAFPALQKEKTVHFRFQLARSSHKSISSDFGDLNGLTRISSRSWFEHSTSYRLPIQTSLLEFSGTYYRPAFEPLALRIVFDTFSGKNLTVFFNREKVIKAAVELPISSGDPIEINTFGILVQRLGSRKNYRDGYLEFSNPTVYGFNSPDTLGKLPPIKIISYPYEAYLELSTLKKNKTLSEKDWRDLRKNRNPDLQYAWALELLYGDKANCNPSRALELLERAAKEDHVLALYQLGLCYYRGYGIVPDQGKALKYLKEAISYDYSPARALHGLILWNQEHRPLFPSAQLKRVLDPETLKSGSYHDHDINIFRRILAGPGESIVPVEMSPQRLLTFSPLATILPKNHVDRQNTTNFYIDHAIAAHFIPAYLFKAWRLEWLNGDPAQIRSALEQGAAGGNRECMTELMRFRAHRGELDATWFTPQRDLQLGDDHVYQLYRACIRKPDFPGVREFLAGQVAEAREIWAKLDQPAGDFLLGLSLWQEAYPALRKHGYLSGTLQEQGFEHLENAAKGNIPEALFLIGRQYFHDDYPSRDRAEKGALLQRAENFLEKAVVAGQLNAVFPAVLLQSEKDLLDFEQLCGRLEVLCRLDYAPAFFLKGKLLSRGGKYPEAAEAYRQAAELGDHRGLRELAFDAEKRKKDAGEANLFWSEYIRRDREYRMQDQYDFFYPTREINLWKGKESEATDLERQKILAEEEVEAIDQNTSPEERKKLEQKELRRQRRTKRMN